MQGEMQIFLKAIQICLSIFSWQPRLWGGIWEATVLYSAFSLSGLLPLTQNVSKI